MAISTGLHTRGEMDRRVPANAGSGRCGARYGVPGAALLVATTASCFSPVSPTQDSLPVSQSGNGSCDLADRQPAMPGMQPMHLRCLIRTYDTFVRGILRMESGAVVLDELTVFACVPGNRR